ncbi:hypothetical protein NEOKW01_1615 [Nematocida sp. AWRm80]|nr:hypothetical protein NEOKW01_1615 [Nematocida sp. AWRm80]
MTPSVIAQAKPKKLSKTQVQGLANMLNNLTMNQKNDMAHIYDAMVTILDFPEYKELISDLTQKKTVVYNPDPFLNLLLQGSKHAIYKDIVKWEKNTKPNIKIRLKQKEEATANKAPTNIQEESSETSIEVNENTVDYKRALFFIARVNFCIKLWLKSYNYAKKFDDRLRVPTNTGILQLMDTIVSYMDIPTQEDKQQWEKTFKDICNNLSIDVKNLPLLTDDAVQKIISSMPLKQAMQQYISELSNETPSSRKNKDQHNTISAIHTILSNWDTWVSQEAVAAQQLICFKHWKTFVQEQDQDIVLVDNLMKTTLTRYDELNRRLQEKLDSKYNNGYPKTKEVQDPTDTENASTATDIEEASFLDSASENETDSTKRTIDRKANASSSKTRYTKARNITIRSKNILSNVNGIFAEAYSNSTRLKLASYIHIGILLISLLGVAFVALISSSAISHMVKRDDIWSVFSDFKGLNEILLFLFSILLFVFHTAFQYIHIMATQADPSVLIWITINVITVIGVSILAFLFPIFLTPWAMIAYSIWTGFFCIAVYLGYHYKISPTPSINDTSKKTIVLFCIIISIALAATMQFYQFVPAESIMN